MEEQGTATQDTKQNELNTALLKRIGQMIHDIRQPLASLQMIVSSTKEIPEEKRIALRDSVISITEISNQLLNEYSTDGKSEEIQQRQLVLVSTLLSNTIATIKSRYTDLPIRFKCEITNLNAFTFIRVNQNDLKRAISNIITNAVEAMPKSGGTIEVLLESGTEWVNITVLDDGKGMPPRVLEKIQNREPITHGKTNGHGIGLTQVRDMVEANYGEFSVASTTKKPYQGTTMVLKFPRVQNSDWLIEEIQLQKDDIVVILDDDCGIHRGWDSRLGHIVDKIPTIKVKHFYDGQEVLEFINGLSKTAREHICLLSDYELIGQPFNGLEIISKAKIKRSILVTSHYDDVKLRSTALQSQVKVLPKNFVHLVPIKISQDKEASELVRVHMVFVDDHKGFTDTLIASHYRHLLTEQYTNPLEFMEEVGKYPKDTVIVMDNFYNMPDGGMYKIDGVSMAETLYTEGFTRLILLSGEEFPTPNYLTMVLKTDETALGNLYSDRVNIHGN